MIVKHESYLSDGAVVFVRQAIGFRGGGIYECRIRSEELIGDLFSE